MFPRFLTAAQNIHNRPGGLGWGRGGADTISSCSLLLLLLRQEKKKFERLDRVAGADAVEEQNTTLKTHLGSRSSSQGRHSARTGLDLPLKQWISTGGGSGSAPFSFK